MSLVTTTKFHYYFPRLVKLQEWMVSDLRNASIKAHTNFLVAMGAFNYIEKIGSFYKYKDCYKVKGRNQTGLPRFDYAINELFNKSYGIEFAKLREYLENYPTICLYRE